MSRFREACGICPYFPTSEMRVYWASQGVGCLRYCSVVNAEKDLPPPQLVDSWVGPVHIFFTLVPASRGKTREQWIEFMGTSGITVVEDIPRIRTKLWRQYAEAFKGSRYVELLNNYEILAPRASEKENKGQKTQPETSTPSVVLSSEMSRTERDSAVARLAEERISEC